MHLPWPNRNIERPVDIVQLSESATFRHGINELAQQLDRSPDEVALEATEALRYMAAFLDPAAYASWLRLGNWLLRAYDIVADETALERLRRLDRRSSLVWLPSHRSYLDWWVLPKLLAARGMSTPYALVPRVVSCFTVWSLGQYGYVESSCSCVGVARWRSRGVGAVDALDVGAGGLGAAGADRPVGRGGVGEHGDRGQGRGLSADRDRLAQPVPGQGDRRAGR